MQNVEVMRIGNGVLSGLGSELGSYAVLTMPLPWEAIRARVDVEPEYVVMVNSIEEEALDQIVRDLSGVSSVVGAGGGAAIDAGKYVAWKLGVPCVSIPTVVSTTAFANSMIAIRRDSQVVYVGDGKARTQLLLIDFDVIGEAPRLLNIAGVADLLALHTACVDWTLAWENGVTEHALASNAMAQADDIVRFIINRAGMISEMNSRAIKLLIDMSIEAVEIESTYPRVGEGSEHFLVYLLERLTQRSFQHGVIVAMALDIISSLQDDGWHDSLCTTMDDIGLHYSLDTLDLSPGLLGDALQQLPAYVQDQGYWYSVVNAKGVSREFIDATLERMAS